MKALHDFAILDTPPESDFDDIAQVAAQVCQTPIALITLIDEDRQWFKAKVGIGIESTPREHAFCAHALNTPTEALIVPDAKLDRRFADNPFVTGEPGIRFYAGAPLVAPGGEALGTLCVVDHRPRQLTIEQARALDVLSRHVITQLQLRRQVREQRRVELALRASEERFELAVRGSAAGIWDWNRETGTCMYSPRYAEMLGYAPAEFPTEVMPFSERVHPEDRERVKAALDAHFSMERRPFHVEFRLRCRSEEFLWVSSTGQAVYDANGQVTRMVGATVDIADRMRSEAKVREQAALIDESRDAIVVCDLSRRITFWSRGAERLYGWTSAEAVGAEVQSLLKIDPTRFEESDRAVRDKGAWIGEMRKVAKGMAPRMVDARWTLLRDERGEPRSILLIDTDATERKRLEDQFLRAQRMESLGTLAGGIAHDLNNLLAPITMGVDLLKNMGPDESGDQVLATIEQSARRGADLVKQVLSFARGVEGARVSVHVGHLIRELEAIVVNTFPKNIRLEARVASDLWLVPGDPTQLQQVLLNLCVNARDAMPAGGAITVRASNLEIDRQYAVMNRSVTPGRYVIIAIVDTGSGIAPEVIERIFEPFFTTKAVGQGTGLGLSTAQGIVRSHGGFMDVKSAPGRGSTFTIYLPAQEASAHTAVPHPVASENQTRGQGELVLVVDDEASIVEITRQTLEANGYRVLTAEDGAQAVGIYAMHRDEIAVVLTDMMMPVMNGSALISALQRLDPKVRIVGASGFNSRGKTGQSAPEGIKYFLTKPYTAASMLTALREALDSPSITPLA